ncbi:MAG: serine--tRNA ligase [Synechococcaceae cyanobacterium RL_1_2]|nr:serine--tRNA ligase [Synechococcaceae cyanobacterium RL_1_2]
MLDLKFIRENPTLAQELLDRRQQGSENALQIQPIVDLDQSIRTSEQQLDQLKAQSNAMGKEIGQKMREGADPQGAEILALRDQGNQLKLDIAALEPAVKEQKTELEAALLVYPNFPADSTPIGKNENENVEVRRWGDELKTSVKVLPHDEIAQKLGLIEFERAVKVAQSRFVCLQGAGAALERALINFMIDRHTAHGYTEVMPPFLVSSESLKGTGQLPKFAEDSFKCQDDDLWLTPTAEVPVTNLYRGEFLDGEELPIHHCAFTPCFRREAGSYGRDTKGLIRLHQFNKVEMVKFVKPETSAEEHEKLVADAEAILQALKLPYRVVELCTGDLGFSANKCYDLEVWLPAAQTYREISSCSNFGDFQARRANIRFKTKGQKGSDFVHTLNGSGLAVGRTMAAVLENYQLEDGRIQVPDILQTYIGRAIL